MSWITKAILAAVVVLTVGEATAHSAPPCQTIFMPDGRLVICCTSGTLMTCF